jgi:glycosyltransferase involved in cell wall biosynthesis
MLAQSPVAGDSRILREASTLAASGHEVHIIGREIPDDFAPPSGVTVSSIGMARGYGLPPGPRRRPLPIRAARWLLLPEHRRVVEHSWVEQARDVVRTTGGPSPDVVHAHDFNTLPLGAELSRRFGARLVYDAHEFWSGRSRIGRPTPLQTARERRLEKEFGRLATAVLTVGEGVATALRQDYGWPHVHVVRNTFEPRIMDVPVLTEPAGAVYAGRLAPYRELEVIAAASHSLDLPVTLIGPADQSWLARFEPGVATVRLPTSIEDVDRVLAQAGIALVTLSDRWPNHRLALPNKLFHALRVGVPVVATDVGELAKTVRQHGLGRLYRPGDHHDLVQAVRSAIADYPVLLTSVAAAKPALTWQSDKAVLLEVYRRLSM